MQKIEIENFQYRIKNSAELTLKKIKEEYISIYFLTRVHINLFIEKRNTCISFFFLWQKCILFQYMHNLYILYWADRGPKPISFMWINPLHFCGPKNKNYILTPKINQTRWNSPPKVATDFIYLVIIVIIILLSTK